MADEKNIRYVLAKLAEGSKLAKDKTEIGGEPLKYRRAYYRLEKHLKDFMSNKRENRVVLLPGLRGVGKTTTLLQLYNYLREKNVDPDRILYFSADESTEYLGLGVYDVIEAFLEGIHRTSFVNLDKELFIFIDEAHFDEKWATAVKIVYDKTDKIFLAVTGSSALSMGMGVDLARRAKKEPIFPLNFSEYMVLKHELFPPKGMAESVRELLFDSGKLIEASTKFDTLRKSFIKKGIPMQRAWEDFLCWGGFPFSLQLTQIDSHERLFGMVARVVEKDVFSLKSFNTDTRNTITRILSFLALQKPGGTSDSNLAEWLGGVSPTLVRSILDVLEKTHLVFSVKPYGGAGKKVRKPWKYYFLSSSLNAAMRLKLGAYDQYDKEMLGVFAETLVASTLFRMKETLNVPQGIYYDSLKGGSDFLIQASGGIIPIEVSIGKKDARQVKNSMRKHGAKNGIVISGSESIKLDEGILHIPITLFSFV
mgnify:CR=1 FL=1